jgi:EAL domain-containing protein (putative c-di-GMP-specific phosphodiesterase class I)/GGDEF domain-containing protein
MTNDDASGIEPREGGHRGYLKLRSVLFDRVTGLPAYPMLIERLRGWLDSRRAVGVIHLEVENLSVVESLYGWQTFDRIVARIAGVLVDGLGDALPAGTESSVDGVAGGRFAIFIPGRHDGAEVDARFLSESAGRLRQLLERRFAGPEFAGLNPPLHFRVGHSRLTLDPFYRFERRLYAAIDEARSSTERLARRHEQGLGEDLRRILEDSDLRTLFQPVVDLRSGEVLGYEALSRGPEGGGLEAPTALFTVSRRLGLDHELDHACRRAALAASGEVPLGRKVFLNGLTGSFGAVSRDTATWPERLHGLLSQPSRWVLEFSERGADEDPGAFTETLTRLKAAGFAVCVEDIGTGFASQAILERLRPDYLKLDASLVREIDRNLIKQELLGSLVRIATRMGSSVIAEGVETHDEARVLAEAGAQFGQGHLFAPPSARVDEPGTREP